MASRVAPRPSPAPAVGQPDDDERRVVGGVDDPTGAGRHERGLGRHAQPALQRERRVGEQPAGVAPARAWVAAGPEQP
jgi:hypothetical protein